MWSPEIEITDKAKLLTAGKRSLDAIETRKKRAKKKKNGLV